MTYLIIIRQSKQYQSYWYLIDVINDSINDIREYLLEQHIYLEKSDIQHISLCENYIDMLESCGSYKDSIGNILNRRVEDAKWKYFNETQNPFYNIKNVIFLGYIQ